MTPPTDSKPITVSELNAAVDELLKSQIPSVWVEGELTDWKPYQSGHIYFGLKDETSTISAAMWRSHALRLPAGVKFQKGMAVVALGEVGVYSPRGQYQLYVQRLLPKGIGAAEEALRRLKEKLLALGYFAPERKRPLPRYPRRLALVTSGRGAAVRDMIEIFVRHWPAHDVVVVSVKVQGEGAAEEIVSALQRLNALHDAETLLLDAIILGRGGGSTEDLAAFNHESVAHAIFRSGIPIVSAVGHEIDTTIADLVADVRATTPTNAADRAIQYWAQTHEMLAEFTRAIPAALLRRLDQAKNRLDDLAQRKPFREPMERIRLREQMLDELTSRLKNSVGNHQTRCNDRVAAVAGRLHALSPLNVLARGYSLTQSADGKIVRAADTLRVGDTISTRLHRGRAHSVVTATFPPEADAP